MTIIRGRLEAGREVLVLVTGVQIFPPDLRRKQMIHRAKDAYHWMMRRKKTLEKRVSVTRVDPAHKFECRACVYPRIADYQLRFLGGVKIFLCHGCLLALEIEIENAKDKR